MISNPGTNNPNIINNNPDIASLRSLLVEWRYSYDELIEQMIEQKLFGIILNDLPRPGIESININNPYNYTSIPSMFELLAALISHARKEQREKIKPLLIKPIQDELLFLYGAKLKTFVPSNNDNKNNNNPPDIVPPLSSPLKFLSTVFLSNEPDSILYKVNNIIEYSQQELHNYMEAQANKKSLPSFAQIVNNNTNNPPTSTNTANKTQYVPKNARNNNTNNTSNNSNSNSQFINSKPNSYSAKAAAGMGNNNNK
jgi:hypothetical protein